jgi:HEAT repeat protein
MSGTSRLSSLLVRDGLIGVKRMEQAFQRQVIYGGALDTILLEMGAIGEDRLTEYLSLASGLPPAERDLVEYFDPRAVQVCPRELAEEFHVAPVAFDGEALRVLVTDPVDLAALEALATRIGAPVQPFVVSELRFSLLVERLFGVPTPPRYLTLAAKVSAAQRPPQVEPTVIVEDVEIRRVAETPRAKTSTGPMSTDTVHKAVEMHEQRRRASGNLTIVQTPPARRTDDAPAAVAPERTPAEVRIQPAPDGKVAAPAVTPGSGGEGSGVVRAPWRGGQTLDPRPLEPKAASDQLARSDDRDAIFAALVRGVRSRTRYVALLVAQQEIAYGRVAIDGEAADPDVAQVALDVVATPALHKVISSASPYIGPVATGNPEVDQTLARLGGVVPPSALLLPVTIRDRVIAVVYAHRGADTLSIVEVAEVLSLAGDAALALSKLILKAKAQGYRKAVAEAGAAPVVADEVPRKAREGREFKGGWARAATPPAGIDLSAVAPGPSAAALGASATGGRAIERVLDEIEAGGSAAGAALDEAVRRARETVPALRNRLPSGRLWVDRYAAAGTRRASQHGPLWALVVRLGDDAVPVLTDLMTSDNRELRYYATLACAEVRAGGLVNALVGRIFDQDFGVRAAAIDALLGYPARELDGALELVRTALHSDAARARAAAHALGDLRDVGAIPDLIAATERDHTTAEEARRALVLLAKQDFGTKAKKWRAWWDKNKDRPRIEWMLDGLGHPDDDVRLSASEELKRLTGEYFGYHYDLPKRERAEAQAKWIRWWEETGRRRFLGEPADEAERPTALLGATRPGKLEG